MIAETDPNAEDRDRLRVVILRAEHNGHWHTAEAARAALKGLLAINHRRLYPSGLTKDIA